jgi:chemotaxis protein histidine kinase CheA
LVYAIVTDAGGAIDVKSAPGQGTTFAIHGPLAEVALARRFDVVVTDEVMPSLTGTALVSVLRHRRPELADRAGARL